jgi:Zn-dependent M28 family amino/carboxypeptidase
MTRLRAYSVELVLVASLLAAVTFFGYLGYGLLRPEVINEPFSGERALTTAERILTFGPRATGTESSDNMSSWLIEQLRLMGWDVVIQPFSVQETVTGRNIIAVRSHSQPGSPVAMLATHYDTRLAADADPDPANHQRPTPGANGGASGVAALLELARTLNVESTGHTVCLAFFDAEQNGGLPGWEPALGSRLFLRSLPNSVPRCASPRFVINLNNTGAADQRFYQDEQADPALQKSLWQAAETLDYGEWFAEEVRALPPGTQDALIEAGLPVVNLVGHDDANVNTMADTLDKLSAETLQRVGMTLETWLETQP